MMSGSVRLSVVFSVYLGVMKIGCVRFGDMLLRCVILSSVVSVVFVNSMSMML